MSVHVPLLSLLIFSPLLVAVLLQGLPARAARWATAASMLATLALACAVLVAYVPAGPRFQLLERAPWIASLNVQYLLGIDGLSVLFPAATAFLFLGALVAAWNHVQEAPRFYYGMLLALQSATLGIFCALDLVLFFVFWEATLVPVFFLLGRWGVTSGASRVAARYVLLMLASGVPILLGIVWMAAVQPVLTFDLPALSAAPPGMGTQYAFLLLCLLGFAFKVPLVPLHTWLPQFALAAPGSLTALLLGLKVGVFGLIRVAIPLAPEAAQSLHWLFAGFGTLALLYGAVGILAQSNLRVGLAYASISHVGLAVLGLAAFSAQGVQGAVSLLLSFSLASGGGFLLLEFLRQRTGTTDIHALGGVAKRMPLLATGFLICGLAGVGMPGTSSFPGEFMLILAALQSHTGAGMAALFGLSIAAGAFLALYRQAFFGTPKRNAVIEAEDLLPREWAVLLIVIVGIGGIGLWPGPWVDILAPAAERWAAGLSR